MDLTDFSNHLSALSYYPEKKLKKTAPTYEFETLK